MNRRIEDKISEYSNEKLSGNGIYYARLADKYRIAKVFVLIVLSLFLILMILFGNGSMRGVHFRYLVKYLDINPVTMEERYADIAYAVGGGSKFAFYHNDLAVLGEGKMTLYDLAGDMRFRENIEKGNPSVDSSGKYLAAYISGKETLTLFHSFDKAFEISFSAPISKVSVSKEGSFAVCLKENGETAVLVFDDDFEMQQTISQKDGVVIDLAITDDGKTLAILTLFGDDGSYFTKLELWNLKKGEIIHSESFQAKKPITVDFFENERFFLILDRMVCFYAAHGDLVEALTLDFDSFQFDADGNRLLFLTPSGVLALYGSNGKNEFSVSVPYAVLDAKLQGETIYLLTENAIILYRDDGECISKIDIESGVREFFILDDESILLCYATETKRISSAE